MYVKCELLGLLAARKVFDQHMEKSKLQDGRPCYKCNICGKGNSRINNIRNHIESVHFPGHFSYNCDYCEKTFKSKNAMCNHVTRLHKGENFWFVILGLPGPVYVLVIFLNTNSVYQPIDDWSLNASPSYYFNNKNPLCTHVSQVHRDGKSW